MDNKNSFTSSNLFLSSSLAQKLSSMFKENLDISGVIITKMDGTGKGGGALSACHITNSPVKFIGTGEKTEDFERFNSKRFVSQLLGMGDIETLLEKAKIAIDENKAKKLSEKLITGDFNLEDLYDQLNSMKKLGSISKIMNLIPGFSNLNIDKNTLSNQEDNMKKWKYAMDSMTTYEKKIPNR